MPVTLPTLTPNSRMSLPTRSPLASVNSAVYPVTSPRIGFSMVRSTPTRMTAMTAANTPILISSEGMLFTGHPLRSG